MSRTRLAPEVRRVDILDAALILAEELGYMNMTRTQIADAAGVTPGLITYYYHTMPQLRRDVMRAAVRRGILPIIAQGLAARDPHAQKASKVMQKRAAALLVG